MDKPVIFFSHSSKDRDIILPLKDKLGKITSGTVDIFMSSDGQSIPFGSNWIHKVEEGLKEARIMFVFVTLLHLNDKIMKLVVQVVVTAANYILSKLFVFKKK